MGRAVLDGRALTDLDLGDASVAGVRMLECLLQDVRAGQLDLPSWVATEVHLLRLRMAKLSAGGATLPEVGGRELRIGALMLEQADLTDVTVDGGKLDLVSLRGSKLRRVTLKDCAIGMLDVSECELEDVVVDGGHVDELVTGPGPCRGLDVTRTTLARVANPGELRGLRMTLAQAESLADQLATALGVDLVREESA